MEILGLKVEDSQFQIEQKVMVRIRCVVVMIRLDILSDHSAK